jgi:hypothetical protein
VKLDFLLCSGLEYAIELTEDHPLTDSWWFGLRASIVESVVYFLPVFALELP